jgi:hypothetical protein
MLSINNLGDLLPCQNLSLANLQDGFTMLPYNYGSQQLPVYKAKTANTFWVYQNGQICQISPDDPMIQPLLNYANNNTSSQDQQSSNTDCPCDFEKVDEYQTWYLTPTCQSGDCKPVDIDVTQKICEDKGDNGTKSFPCDELQPLINELNAGSNMQGLNGLGTISQDAVAILSANDNWWIWFLGGAAGMFVLDRIMKWK